MLLLKEEDIGQENGEFDRYKCKRSRLVACKFQTFLLCSRHGALIFAHGPLGARSKKGITVSEKTHGNRL